MFGDGLGLAGDGVAGWEVILCRLATGRLAGHLGIVAGLEVRAD